LATQRKKESVIPDSPFFLGPTFYVTIEHGGVFRCIALPREGKCGQQLNGGTDEWFKGETSHASFIPDLSRFSRVAFLGGTPRVVYAFRKPHWVCKLDDTQNS
jgi:hypothetical protein